MVAMAAPLAAALDGTTPLYREVKRLLTRALADGRWAPGEALPSESRLAATFGVSIGTLRKAVDELVAERVLVRRQGSGTFVATHGPSRYLFHFFHVVPEDGDRVLPEPELLAFERGRATPDEAAKLGLAAGERVHRFSNLLRIAGAAVALDEIVLPHRIAPDLTERVLRERASTIYHLYQVRYGVNVVRAVERLRARIAARAEARHLPRPSGGAAPQRGEHAAPRVLRGHRRHPGRRPGVNAVLLVLPDFALIAAGFVLARGMRLEPAFWAGAEKLTYFVLFPALLFYSNARQPLDVGTAGPMLLTVLAAIAAGIVLGLAGRCHFRFNSYIALAAASRLGGDQGLGLMALAIGVAVPFVNVAAVWGLARGNSRHVAREIATNPLVLSCVLGIAWGALRLPMPDLLAVTLSRLGAAALVVGLLAIGAALTPRLPRGTGGFVAWTLAVKLLALPVVALAVARSLGLSGEAFRIALVFAALPTAPAAYILTVRLGGDGRTAAALVTLSVIASLVTLPPAARA